MRTLQWLLQEVADHEQQRYNAMSLSTAYLNAQLIWALYGLNGGKGPKPKLKLQDFLPFPEAGKEKRSPSSPTQLQATRVVLKRLLASGALPYPIFMQLYQGPH